MDKYKKALESGDFSEHLIFSSVYYEDTDFRNYPKYVVCAENEDFKLVTPTSECTGSPGQYVDPVK